MVSFQFFYFAHCKKSPLWMKSTNPYDEELVQLLYEIVLFEYQNIDI